MAIALAGIALGVAAGLALSRLMIGLLYDVTPTDPATFAAVTGLFAAAALAACSAPALRATLVDPIVALRCSSAGLQPAPGDEGQDAIKVLPLAASVGFVLIGSADKWLTIGRGPGCIGVVTNSRKH